MIGQNIKEQLNVVGVVVRKVDHHHLGQVVFDQSLCLQIDASIVANDKGKFVLEMKNSRSHGKNAIT